MSTRCLICKKLPDGKVRGIYCHHDGNLRWVGRTLLDCYTDEKRIDALLDLGAISSLGKTPDHADDTEAFQRDMGYPAEGNCAFVREAGCEVETGSIRSRRSDRPLRILASFRSGMISRIRSLKNLRKSVCAIAASSSIRMGRLSARSRRTSQCSSVRRMMTRKCTKSKRK